jgi:hypothetical protein
VAGSPWAEADGWGPRWGRRSQWCRAGSPTGCCCTRSAHTHGWKTPCNTFQNNYGKIMMPHRYCTAVFFKTKTPAINKSISPTWEMNWREKRAKGCIDLHCSYILTYPN